MSFIHFGNNLVCDEMPPHQKVIGSLVSKRLIVLGALNTRSRTCISGFSWCRILRQQLRYEVTSDCEIGFTSKHFNHLLSLPNCALSPSWPDLSRCNGSRHHRRRVDLNEIPPQDQAAIQHPRGRGGFRCEQYLDTSSSRRFADLPRIKTVWHRSYFHLFT